MMAWCGDAWQIFCFSCHEKSTKPQELEGGGRDNKADARISGLAADQHIDLAWIEDHPRWIGEGQVCRWVEALLSNCTSH